MGTRQPTTLRWQVTLPALILLSILLGVSATFGDQTSVFFKDLQTQIVSRFGGLYIWSLSGILVLSITIACSPAGRLRLGDKDAKPEFSTLSWFTMSVKVRNELISFLYAHRYSFKFQSSHLSASINIGYGVGYLPPPYTPL